MRVISGKYGGRRLVPFKADFIRPTTDRVKESEFNILGSSIESSRVLDLFSGTGNLGIECLSRGCLFVHFVELRRGAIDIIQENLNLLKITDSFEITQKDVFKFLNSYEGDGFDFVFVDPPFTEALAHDVMKAIAKSSVYTSTTQILIESAKKEKLLSEYDSLVQTDRREFGDKFLTIFGVSSLQK